MDDKTPNVALTRIENDSILGNKLSDSLLRQSLNGSVFQETMFSSHPNPSTSIFLRKNSQNTQNNISTIENKENCQIGVNQGRLSSKLSNVFGGFTTLTAHSKSTKLLNELPKCSLAKMPTFSPR
jgi:hypothetical protein